MILTPLTRTQETAHRAETADRMTPMVVVDTHAPSSSPTLQVALALNNLRRPVLVVKIHMLHMEATIITWRCGMQPWLNNSSNNKVQVSKPDRLGLDDDDRTPDL